MRFKNLLVLSCTALLSLPVFSHEFQVDSLHIDHPWSRAMPPVVKTGAAYMLIENRGDTPDTLLSVETPIAGKAELHEHAHVDGLMKMQQIQSVAIDSGASVHFSPGGYHVMLFDLQQPLVAGESFPLTLHFEQAGSIEVQVDIEDGMPASSEAGSHASDPHASH